MGLSRIIILRMDPILADQERVGNTVTTEVSKSVAAKKYGPANIVYKTHDVGSKDTRLDDVITSESNQGKQTYAQTVVGDNKNGGELK